MAIRLPRKRPPNRRRGERASLSRETIVAAGLRLLAAEGVDGFTARSLARKLGVYPGSVLARFDDGFSGLRAAMAEAALADVAPPFSPATDPAEYLQELFRNALLAVAGKGAVADLVALSLRYNRLTAPSLLEGVLTSLLAAKVPAEAVPIALDLIFAQLVGMLLIECGPKRIRRAEIKELSQVDFPALHSMVAVLSARPAATDLGTIADRHSADITFFIKKSGRTKSRR